MTFVRSPMRYVPLRSNSDILDGLTFDRLVTALFFLLVAAVACLMPIQSDTWWQLRAGQDFWETGQVPLVESYSHTAAGRFWMNHEWLSEAVFYAFYWVGGLPLLIIFAAIVATTTMAVTWSMMRGPTILRVALCGLSLGAVSISWTPRPHLLTLFLVAACAKLMVTGRHRWLPLLFLLWANLHGGFTLGVGLLGAFWLAGLAAGASAILSRSVLAAVCLLMTLLTPLGLRFWEELPASLSRLQAYEVQEWQGPTFGNVAALPFWLAVVALVVLLFRHRRALFVDPADRVLLIASMLFVPLALTSLRNIPPFLVLSLPAISRSLRIFLPEPVKHLSRAQTRTHAAILAGAGLTALVLVALAWTTPQPRLQWSPISSDVVEAVDSCEGPLYNSYDDGGFLVWFMPHRKVFLDSRQDPYPVELIQQDIRAQFQADYKDMFDEHSIRCAFVRSGVPLHRRLQADGWHVQHGDAVWTVLKAPDRVE